jgi:hypothetical protein
LFSVGFPTGVQGCAACVSHLTQRTSFPLPSSGRPHGHREAPLLICNFQRLAHGGPYCKSATKKTAEIADCT